MQKKSNYEIQAENAILSFPQWDHEKIAKKFNLNLDKDYLYIKFIGQNYQLNRKTGAIKKFSKNDYVSAGYNEIMSILDLFDHSKENLSLSGKWCTPNSLKGTVYGGNTNSQNTMFQKYETFFSDNFECLDIACEKLDGKKINEAAIGYIINIFDFLPVKFLFYKPDGDFPAEIKILWDENILDYIKFETTFFAVFHLLERLTELITEM